MSATCTEPAPSFGYDVAWVGRPEADASSNVTVVGGGDSAAALLHAVRGRCHGSPLTRTLVAFHAARSKHTAVARVPRANETLELFPRFLVPVPRRRRD